MKKILTLYLVFIFVSFIGFVYETLLAIILRFNDLDRGFLALPLCPIYGIGVILTYLIFGLPIELRIFSYRILTNKKIKIYLYFLFSLLLATFLELIVGYFFEKIFSKVLWDYSSMLLSLNKYCSLIPSLCWGLAITIFMNNIFEKLYNKIYKIRLDIQTAISIFISIMMTIDLLSIIFKW